jgi:hypothetical protein
MTRPVRTPAVPIAIALLAAFVVGPMPAGAIQMTWLHQFGTRDADDAQAVAVDAAGDTYVVGQTFGALAGQTSAGMIDAFVRKYDPAGDEVWTHQFGSTERDMANGVAVDGAGDVWVVGQTFGSLPGQMSNGGWDAFLRRYDPAGNELWTRQFGGGGGETAAKVAVDAGGDAYVVGGTRAALPGQTTAGDYDAFLRKYDPAGNEVWTRQFGTPAEDYALAVTLDGAGNPVVAGETGGLLAGAAAAGALDSFVRKYDAAGGVLWTRQFGSAMDDYAVGAAVAPGGDVFVVGTTQGAFPHQKSAGDSDAYIATFSADGGDRWARQFGTRGADDAEAIVFDAAGHPFVAGRAGGALAGQPWAGQADGFLMATGPTGDTIWTRQFGGPADDYVAGLAVGKGGLYAVGGTTGALAGQTTAGERDAFVLNVA